MMEAYAPLVITIVCRVLLRELCCSTCKSSIDSFMTSMYILLPLRLLAKAEQAGAALAGWLAPILV